jgi:hypothetical protein
LIDFPRIKTPERSRSKLWAFPALHGVRVAGEQG